MFAHSLRTTLAAALLALSVVPGTAFADGSAPQAGAETTRAVRQGKHEKVAFPIPATDFKTKSETRLDKSREHLIASMAKRGVGADKQKEVLAKFDAGASKVRTEVEKVCADGTVTKDEAHAVRKLAREMRGHKKGHKHGKDARNADKGEARG